MLPLLLMVNAHDQSSKLLHALLTIPEVANAMLRSSCVVFLSSVESEKLQLIAEDAGGGSRFAQKVAGKLVDRRRQMRIRDTVRT